MAELRTRTSLHNQLKKIKDLATDPASAPARHEYATTLINRVNDIMQKIETVHATILQNCVDDAAAAVQYAVMEGILETYMEAESVLYTIRGNLAPPPPVITATSSNSSLKLPTIDLPAFDGKYDDWPSFEDLFVATIHKSSLSGSQKLQYLKTCIKGEAATLVKSFTITDANYTEAWKLLSERYSNKREIVQSLVKKILNQPSLKSESSSTLQVMLNTTMESIRSLKVLGRPVDKWDDLLVVAIIDKLDPETKAEWAKSLQGTDPPAFKEVQVFLEKHIRSLVARGGVTNKVTNSNPNNFNQRTHARSHHLSTATPSCTLCKGSHYLYQCSKLLELPPSQRMPAVKRTNACLNCLREGHSVKTCTSKFTCKECKRKHHTILHSNETNQTANQVNTKQETSQGSSSAAATPSTSKTVSSHTAATFTSENSQVILKTAIVNITDMFGNKRPCRVLLDDGSEASFVTDKCAKALGLQRSRADVIIQGVAVANVGHAQWRVVAHLESRVHDASVDVELLILPKVTGTMPRVPCDTTLWNHIINLELADPSFHQPGEIDILLGADVVPSIMRDGRREGRRLAPIAQNSIFGWVLSGKVSVSQQQYVKSHHVTCIEDVMQRFWKVEDLPNRQPLSQEEATCEAHFISTHSRLPNGRYSVRLPFNEKVKDIGATRDLAMSRLYQLERRFKRHPAHHEMYKTFMREYLELGHMELVPDSTEKKKAVYIPHHFVIKEDSKTSRLRVVFDGSMKSSSGVSLNDALLVGPTIQEDLFSILLSFRTHHIALKADVAKMYRQFQVHEDDRDYQRILWRDNPEEPVREYRLTTVTYGTACAPFLATRCLTQLAEEERTRFPEAAAEVNNHMYVDDLLGGSNSTRHAIKLADDLNQLCTAGGLELRKWCSSDEEVIQTIPESRRESTSNHEFGQEEVKTLGIHWNATTDEFFFKSKESNNALTKRGILSEIAKTFDPLGWLSPIIISSKILLQDLWRNPVGWDEALSEDIIQRWKNYLQQLKSISRIRIPRCVIAPEVTDVQLHGFSDSSEKAYGCSAYIRYTTRDGGVIVNLLAARSKVAPLRQTTLPRLELCGAYLLSQTIESILKVITFPCSLFAWTDSTIVLKWITSPSKKWKTFVANRVAAIQDVLPPETWRHVKGTENPADLPSRGVSVNDLVQNSLWWHGPEWLTSGQFPVSTPFTNMEEVATEERSKIATSMLITPRSNLFLERLFEKCSTLQKLISTVAWLTRYTMFVTKIVSTGNLTTSERSAASFKIIKLIQANIFHEDIDTLKQHHEVKTSSKLKTLSPVIDSNGILRVGGRLQNSSLHPSEKHPVILPGNHPFTTLLIQDCHRLTMHGGFSVVLSTLRRKYWIVNGRDVVRFVLRKCVTCRRVRATTCKQLMGNLPAARVTANRPFLHCAVDFAGPFMVTMRKGRGASPDKCYLSVFVCFSTKACHLEVVTSLSSDAFIACYRRFVARRGVSSHVHSDCGTNFVGASKELQHMFKLASKDIQQQLSLIGTAWVFNSPAAPHQNGLVEAAVKSAKYHIKRTIGKTILGLEQFQTLLCNVESCLNSRPLCALSCDPLDTDVLTPGHFLIGEPLNAIPEPDVTHLSTGRLNHWQHIQQMSQHFWRRWRDEYLTTLQQRVKWNRKEENVIIGDLVVIREESSMPNQWKLGRVIQTHPGKDGLVRRATVKTALGEVTRPIHKLCVILHNNEH